LPPKPKRVIQIFCPGGVSHLDTFDYKPELERRSGQPMPGGDKDVTFQGANGNLMRSPWAFAPAGQSGKLVTTKLPHLARHIDRMAFIHSMQFTLQHPRPRLRRHEHRRSSLKASPPPWRLAQLRPRRRKR
jgi:hypothetical protein